MRGPTIQDWRLAEVRALTAQGLAPGAAAKVLALDVIASVAVGVVVVDIR